MNNQEARFMRIRRFSEEEVAALHDVEREADARWRGEQNHAARGSGWNIMGAQKIVELEVGKEAFWSPRLGEDERARAVDAFVKSAPVRRAFAMLNDEKKTEVEAQHAADWVVWKLAPFIGTSAGDNFLRRAATS